MTITSIGDLASSMQLRRDTGRIKADLSRFTQELSSGVSSNLISKLNGDYGPLAGLEQGLARMESYRSVIEEFRLGVSAQQLVLSKLRTFGEISDVFLTMPDAANQTLITNAGTDALAGFTSALAALNTEVGGRSVFSGIETDRPAVADAETILADIEAELALSGATTAADVAAVVTAWFNPGGRFDSIGYLGGVAATTSIQLSDNEVATPLTTAEDDVIRDQLSALALGALLGRNVLAGSLTEQGVLARTAGERLIATNDQLVGSSARLGTLEAQIERASVEIKSQKDGLEIARANLVETDPYETAVRLQNSETQLQTIYTLTARLSQLSLVNYL